MFVYRPCTKQTNTIDDPLPDISLHNLAYAYITYVLFYCTEHAYVDHNDIISTNINNFIYNVQAHALNHRVKTQ